MLWPLLSIAKCNCTKLNTVTDTAKPVRSYAVWVNNG